jgi:hypothetical protein
MSTTNSDPFTKAVRKGSAGEGGSVSDSLKNYRPRRDGRRLVTACWWALCALFRLKTARGVLRLWRAGFEFETIRNSIGGLYSDGLLEPVRDQNGALVLSEGRILWSITEEGIAERARIDFEAERDNRLFAP